ncbi:hypothetical protein LN995_19955, partial [Pontibacter silvestris]|nr:hypothetical protein [Pontibacter silvestris]
MPNGRNLLGHYSSTQSALIVPFPHHPQQYYLFAIDAIPQHSASPFDLTYSVVNMSLDGGLGDVETSIKNISLMPSAAEKLTAVPHANGQDLWVISHGADNDEFYVFLLSEAGVSGPDTYRTGIDYGGVDRGVAGYLKASPNGKKLANALWSDTAVVELFDFDAATGTISNANTLSLAPLNLDLYSEGRNVYGISFSPDNTKLYVSGYSITQFDLSLPTTQEIVDSQEEVTAYEPFSYSLVKSLQLGPDGRLYNNASANSFYVINGIAMFYWR